RSGGGHLMRIAYHRARGGAFDEDSVARIRAVECRRPICCDPDVVALDVCTGAGSGDVDPDRRDRDDVAVAGAGAAWSRAGLATNRVVRPPVDDDLCRAVRRGAGAIDVRAQPVTRNGIVRTGDADTCAAKS